MTVSRNEVLKFLVHATLKEAKEIEWAARFWGKVSTGSDDQCWIWTAGTTRGYGSLGAPGGGKTLYAHRVAWELYFGAPFPKGMMALHSCDTPLCCNPHHIRPGTAKENAEDAARRGRYRTQARTHCDHGHAFTEGNIYRDKQGRRLCRTCRLEGKKKTYQRTRSRAARAAKGQQIYRPQPGKTGYFGVTEHASGIKRFQGYHATSSKRRSLGYFATASEAARARDAYVKTLPGFKGQLNFPEVEHVRAINQEGT